MKNIALVNNSAPLPALSECNHSKWKKYLVEKNNDVIDFKLMFSGLKLISDYLDKSILKPNNISHPKPRIEFLNSIRE